MKLLLNQKRLLEMLRDFHAFSNIRVNISDIKPAEILAWPGDMSDYCAQIQSGPTGNAYCQECDRQAFETAVKRGVDTYVYTCHAGLMEAIAIIRIHGEVLGYMMIGQMREQGDAGEQWAKLRKKVEHLGVPIEDLANAYAATPSEDRERMQAAASIMRAVLTCVQMEEQIRIQNELLSQRVERMIRDHMGESLSIATLANGLEVSKTTLCTAVKKDFGCTVNELIRKHRLARAQNLLQKSSLQVAAVAEKCGIYNGNYFSRLFKQELGVTPSQFRQLCGQYGKELREGAVPPR